MGGTGKVLIQMKFTAIKNFAKIFMVPAVPHHAALLRRTLQL
jgi:hypothetical protein